MPLNCLFREIRSACFSIGPIVLTGKVDTKRLVEGERILGKPKVEVKKKVSPDFNKRGNKSLAKTLEHSLEFILIFIIFSIFILVFIFIVVPDLSDYNFLNCPFCERYSERVVFTLYFMMRIPNTISEVYSSHIYVSGFNIHEERKIHMPKGGGRVLELQNFEQLKAVNDNSSS